MSTESIHAVTGELEGVHSADSGTAKSRGVERRIQGVGVDSHRSRLSMQARRNGFPTWIVFIQTVDKHLLEVLDSSLLGSPPSIGSLVYLSKRGPLAWG